MSLRLLLFDDAVAREWEPFALTRPAGELLYGTLLLRERIERWLQRPASGYVGPSALVGFEEPGSPQVVEPDDVDAADAITVLLSTRYVPSLAREGAGLRIPASIPPGGRLLTVEGAPAGWISPPGEAPPRPSDLARRASDDQREAIQLAGQLLPDPWTLMAGNPSRIAEDLAAGLVPEADGVPAELTPPAGSHRLGDHPVTVGPGVRIDPGVVLDARSGPIHLGRDVEVKPLTRIEGPAYVGAGSTILGGVLSTVSCGPVCKLHGEIDTSVVLGYSNKAHAGYLGHAVIGRWVNLGAGTTNSDLKNTYGPVRLPGPDGRDEIETGLLKVGVFLGDHVRTAIGTLLNTGTVVGAGSILFADPPPARWVAPFSWGADPGAYRKEAFLATVEKVMARRRVSLGPGAREVLARAWERAAARTTETDREGTDPSAFPQGGPAEGAAGGRP